MQVVSGTSVLPRLIIGISMVVAVSCVGRSGVGPNRGAVTMRNELARYTGVWVHKESRGLAGFRIPFASGDTPPPEVVQAVVPQVQSFAGRFAISVDDSLFTLAGDVPGWSLALPLDGNQRVIGDSTGFEFSVSLEWRGETPLVHRSFGARRAIVDALEITEDDVLVVTRTVRWGPDHSRGNLQYVYVRGGGTDGGDTTASSRLRGGPASQSRGASSEVSPNPGALGPHRLP